MAVDLDKWLYYSPNTVDKVVATYTGSLVLADASESTTTIDHGFGIKVFTESLFSIDGDNYYPVASTIGTPATGSSANMGIAVSTTQIKIYSYNNTGSEKTFYYRILVIWPT